MRIYTRTGDKGSTSLVYGQRVTKDDPRVEAYGTVDEANSMIGLAASYLNEVEWEGKVIFLQRIYRIQTILFHVGAELSTPSNREVAWKLTKEHISELEQQIDEWDAQLSPLQNFILPTGDKVASTFHLARALVRRAERRAVIIQDELDDSHVITYLNRLSDYLFVAARYVNQELGGMEITLQVD